jgi:hypothetical protein
MTDGHTVYPSIGAEFAGHDTVDHSANETSAPIFGVPTPPKTTSRSSSAASMVAISTSARPTCIGTLPSSIFRYNNRIGLGIGDIERADRALKGVKGKRLTYRTARG